jgi:hypothetical protein
MYHANIAIRKHMTFKIEGQLAIRIIIEIFLTPKGQN